MHLFMDYAAQGKMQIGHFHEKTEQQLAWWYSGLVDYLKEKDMIQIPDCSYARFIQNKFPQVWEKYVSECP